MAGLQYNFFPTDFLFPQTHPADKAISGRNILPIGTQIKDQPNDSKQPTSLNRREINKKKIILTALPSSSTALAPINKKGDDQLFQLALQINLIQLVLGIKSFHKLSSPSPSASLSPATILPSSPPRSVLAHICCYSEDPGMCCINFPNDSCCPKKSQISILSTVHMPVESSGMDIVVEGDNISVIFSISKSVLEFDILEFFFFLNHQRKNLAMLTVITSAKLPQIAKSSHCSPHSGGSSHRSPNRGSSHLSPHKGGSSHKSPHKGGLSHRSPHKGGSSHDRSPRKGGSSHKSPHKGGSSHSKVAMKWPVACVELKPRPFQFLINQNETKERLKNENERILNQLDHITDGNRIMDEYHKYHLHHLILVIFCAVNIAMTIRVAIINEEHYRNELAIYK
ncbi:hypothetical protein LguiA_024500 [Lonicera macranthoides]